MRETAPLSAAPPRQRVYRSAANPAAAPAYAAAGCERRRQPAAQADSRVGTQFGGWRPAKRGRRPIGGGRCRRRRRLESGRHWAEGGAAKRLTENVDLAVVGRIAGS